MISYILIFIIAIIIIILFLLVRSFYKKGIKFSLFGESSFLSRYFIEKDIGFGNSSESSSGNDSFTLKNSDNSLNKKIKKRQVNPPVKKLKIKNEFDNLTSEKIEAPKVETQNKKEEINKEDSNLKTLTSNVINVNTPSDLLKINTYQDIYTLLGKSDISNVVNFFEINNLGLIGHFQKRGFNSSKEIEEMVKNRVVSFLNDQFDLLKDNISHLRKTGKDMNDLNFLLFSIPLKVKVFSATFTKKDFDIVLKKIESLKDILKNYS